MKIRTTVNEKDPLNGGSFSLLYRKDDYLIESFLVVSVDIIEVESPAIFVESILIVEVDDESVTVVEVSVLSVLELEQAVASAIIASIKKADFAMVVRKF
ncbi:hypothetical protein GCM10027592_20010 [Spirosoma flavus]